MQELYNPKTNTIATPNANTTPQQQATALTQGFTTSSNTPITNTSTVITPTDLTKTTPLPIPSVNTGSSVNAISGITDTTLSNAEKLLNENINKQTTNVTDKTKTVEDIMNSILDTQNSRSTLETNANIPELAKLSNDAFTGLQSSKRAQDKETKAILNSTGLTASQKDAQISELNRKYASEQADLSIAYDVANRNYSNAQATVDRKIELQLEPLKTKLQFQTQFLNDAKDSLSKSESTKIQLLIDNNKRLLDTQQSNLKDISSIQLEAAKNGAPINVITSIGKSTNVNDAITNAGSYLKDPNAYIDAQIKKAQLANINSEIDKRNAETKNLNIPNITNPDAGKYSTALSVILGSGKFNSAQRADIVNSINSGEDAFTVIKNQAKNIMGQAEATNVTKLEVARDTLSNIADQLQQFYANGGSTSIISGNFEKVINKLGEVNDPKLVDLATQIQGNLQIYRNAISGTAYSAQEGKDIASIFPGINKSQGLNTAILSARDKLFNAVIDSSYRSALGKTYDELKKSETSQNTNQQSNKTITVQGKQFTVGQLYSDAKGNTGSFDVNGKWIPKQ